MFSKMGIGRLCDFLFLFILLRITWLRAIKEMAEQDSQ